MKKTTQIRKKYLSLFILFFIYTISSYSQYSETFSTADKGILSGACPGGTSDSCNSTNFTDVNWFINGNLSGLNTGDYIKTSSGKLEFSDIDEEICWESPVLDISAVGGSVSISVDLEWVGHDGSEYIDVEYSIDEGPWTQIANQFGGSSHTVGDLNSNYTSSGTVNISGIATGANKLSIRICTDFNSSSEFTRVDNVSVPESGVKVFSANTDPSISLANTVLGYTEGDSATQIDATATVNDSDGDSDWDGGTLATQITANAEAADEISISDTDGDGTAITISGINILANGTVVGTLSASGGIVTNGTILTITFNTNATNAIVQEVLQSLRYRNTSTTPGTSNRTITVTATDKNAASANDTRTVSVSSVPTATPVVTTPSGAITVNAATQTISGTHTKNGVTVHAYVDANNDGTADNAVSLGSATVSGNTWSFSVNLTQDAANNFVVQANDSGDTSSDVDVPTITEDSTSPANPIVTTPSGAITINAGSQTISGTLTENGVTVHLYADANNDGTADNSTSLGSDTVSGNSWSLSVNLTSDTTHNYVVQAVDDAGNTSSDVDVPTITEDSTSPANPIITTPSGAITINAGSQTISGTLTENGVTVHLYADANNDGTADNSTSLGSDTVSGNSWSLSVNLTPDTTHNYVVQAVDNAGNTSSDVDVPTITEDSTNPANPIVTTPSGAITINADTQTISGSHTENGVTVHAYVDANNDGTADNSVSLGSDTVSGNSWSFNVNLTQNSINNFVVQAEDDAGNTSSHIDVPTITETSAITWTGATSNSWNTASNWNTNSVPVTTSDVAIPNGMTNYPTISSSVTVNSINIASGASLIANASVTGTTTYSRNLPTTNWYLVSAPVSGETQQDVIDNHTFATGSGSNIGIGAFTNNGATPWIYATDATTGLLVSGAGVSMKLATAGDVSITGNIETSNVSFPIATGSRNNFNLIGNPYTSYVNSSTFTAANIGLLSEQTVWLWDGSQYVTYNSASPIQIAPAQGFFVEASGSGNVTFSTSNQSHQSSDTFMKQAPKTSFELFISEGKNKKSTKVFFIDGKTKGFDNGYDSKMYGGVNHKFAVFTELLSDNEGKKLAIQTLPNSNIEKMVIPVGLISDGNKEIIFSVNSQNLPSDTQIFLEDRINNKFINLSEGEHTVSLTNASKGIGQFYIHTTAQKLNTPSTSLENVSMYKSDVQEITVTGLRAKANIKVYSILGKEIVNTNINSNGVSKITLPVLASGVYIVKLNSDLGNMSKKIILE
ncbi:MULTISPECIES: T9SS type A sorting domain-containing protein [unclassified Tenacibaculum]|uniref:T9SS type A sorting domain-containing protein n=1 Tax=unclassified Tenacibaculum TaxID=2635139 RepID=UPI001F2ED0B7|nr:MULTISPECIES: T9SS type A sorting domain-containing protein [unclassified Tenacibaculum]MCF2873312.1 T9SS type A sorting domain-containing protein [Tenacibaculum sp. Cn5-1]MCF2933468.1 T9SS type A sorting domain-containing protein [Tenacibaculum sp. Cn5-34]MCG7509950.1 T9SS type A sorting domain-containing protein [Tenacibaculum sp. Cn5-46]